MNLRHCFNRLTRNIMVNIQNQRCKINKPNVQSINTQSTPEIRIQDVKESWNQYSDTYSKLDSCPQTFYFTLLNQLKIKKASNILEIACGAGLLLPFAIDQKRPEAQYVATDLSSSMIKNSYSRLQAHFMKYNSKITLEQWMKKQYFILHEANGQKPLLTFGKFDMVICNLVLMLTPNPKNILHSVYLSTTDNATMGITIWGDRKKSTFLTLIGRSIKSLGLPVSNKRSPFYYQEQIHKDLKQIGWNIEFQWQQSAPFSLTGPNQIDAYLLSLKQVLSQYSDEQKNKIKSRAKQIYIQSLKSKSPLMMSNKLFIVKKSK